MSMEVKSGKLMENGREKRIAIWGVGENFQKKKDFIYRYIKPVMCVDRNCKLWGKEVLPEIECQSPEKLMNGKIDTVVITPENSRIVHEIKGELGYKYDVYILNYIWDENEIALQKERDFGPEDNRIKHFSCEVGSCVCNLNCSYCYVNFQNSNLKHNMQFSHTIPFIIKALSRKRLGGRAYFNMCGEGETLLKPNYIKLVYGLLKEGHFVGVITNGTVTQKLEELIAFPEEMKKRLLVQFSCHYLELKRQNMLDVYFKNVNLVRNGGVSVSLTMPGSDEYIPYKSEIKKCFLDKAGVLPVISAIRSEARPGEGFPLGSKLSWKEYYSVWEEFSSRSLEMRNNTLGKFTEQCYSGINSGWINLQTGELRSCCPGQRVDNIYNDIKQKINFWEEPHCCEDGYCSHNGMFLSGRLSQNVQLPTWYEMFSKEDKNGNSTFVGQMREATDYCCDY